MHKVIIVASLIKFAPIINPVKKKVEHSTIKTYYGLIDIWIKDQVKQCLDIQHSSTKWLCFKQLIKL